MTKKLLFAILISNLVWLLSCSGSKTKSEESEIPNYADANAPADETPTHETVAHNSKEVFPEEEKSESEKKKIVADNYQKFGQALKTKQYRAASDIAGDILAKNPKDTKALNGLAVVALEQGKLELARMYLSRILVQEQLSAAYNNLGIVEMRSDNLRLALVDFKKAVELDSSNKSAHANLGTIYLQYRNYQAAADQFQLAANNGEETAAVFSNMGFALRGAGRFSDAEDAYEKALTKDGANPTILYNYAVLLLEHNNDKAKGMKMINKLRSVAREPAILDKASQLVQSFEAKEKNGKAP